LFSVDFKKITNFKGHTTEQSIIVLPVALLWMIALTRAASWVTTVLLCKLPFASLPYSISELLTARLTIPGKNEPLSQ
jgi:hypothetical protein